jgi:hypothetical protein
MESAISIHPSLAAAGDSSSRSALSDAQSRHNSQRRRHKRTTSEKSVVSAKVETVVNQPIRLGDKTDAQDAYEFDLEVYSFMRGRELERRPVAHYFKNQTKITPEMRTVIIDWLIDVHKSLKMHTDTLFTAVELLDLFLSKVDFDKAKLQLLSCTALLIAGKSEEQHPASARKFVYVSNKTFTVLDMARMESELFLCLDCQVNVVHSSQFLKRFLRLIDTTTKITMLAHFINEISLLDEASIEMCPSQRAAAVLCLAMTLELGAGQWTADLVRDTGYTVAELEPTVKALLGFVRRFQRSKYQAITKKYSPRPLACVSDVDFPAEIQLQ